MVDLRHGSRTAAKRLGAGGPSPGGGPSSQPGRKAFGLRRDCGVLAWELGKPCGCGRINHFLRLKNNTHGICHAEFSISAQVWQIKAHGCDLKGPTCFHCSNSELICNKSRNHYINSTNLDVSAHSSCHTTVINRFNFLKDIQVGSLFLQFGPKGAPGMYR